MHILGCSQACTDVKILCFTTLSRAEVRRLGTGRRRVLLPGSVLVPHLVSAALSKLLAFSFPPPPSRGLVHLSLKPTPASFVLSSSGVFQAAAPIEPVRGGDFSPKTTQRSYCNLKHAWKFFKKKEEEEEKSRRQSNCGGERSTFG